MAVHKTEERSSDQFRDDVWSASRIPAFVGFLDMDHLYKTVAIQFPQDAGLPLVILPGFNLEPLQPRRKNR